jgi:Glycosyl hydrolase family 45
MAPATKLRAPAPAERAAVALFLVGLAHAVSCDSGGASGRATTGATGATGGSTTAGGAGSASATSASSGAGGATTGNTSTASTGTSSSTTTGGTSTSSTTSTSSGAATPTCTDGVKNGDETGVDCGGSCPACVPYVLGPPNTSTNVQNACTNGGDVSFICPRFMLFSGEMKQAAADDAAAMGWPAGSFNYGVATLNGAECCACYQIVYGTVENDQYDFTPPKPLIIQDFNTGGENNAFDVFMGKGGEGAQTNGCTQLYSSYPSIGEPNGGGIRASSISACGTTTSSVASAACVSAITSDCDQINASSSYVTATTQTSCIEANSATSLYHDNWNVRARQVECPTALTEVTGCKPNAGGNPQPDPTVQTVAQASSWGTYSTTTMEDCCKPSCAWPGNVQNTQAPWSAMYQCDGSGNPMHD